MSWWREVVTVPANRLSGSVYVMTILFSTDAEVLSWSWCQAAK